MKKLLSLLLVALLVNVSGAFAADKTSVDAVTELVDVYNTPEINYPKLSKKLQQIEEMLKSGQVSIKQMSEEVSFLDETRGSLFIARKSIEQELTFVQKRIEALGAAPEDGSQELTVIAQKREEFGKEEAYQKGKLAEADVLLTKIDELNALILDIRNKELLGNLLTKQTPLYYPSVLLGASKQFVEFVFDIIRSPVLWYGELNAEQREFVKSNTIPVGLTVLFSLWFGIWLRLFIMRRFGYKKEDEHPRYGKKVFAAVFVAIAYGVIPSSIIIGFLVWIISTKVLTIGFFGLTLASLLYKKYHHQR